MPNATHGSVASLWRYPVKSMLGEELTAIDVTERGLLGDRAYALVDSADGKAATAKNPKKWPTLFAQAQSNPAPRGRKQDFPDAERLVKRLVAHELTLSFVPDVTKRLWRRSPGASTK